MLGDVEFVSKAIIVTGFHWSVHSYQSDFVMTRLGEKLKCESACSVLASYSFLECHECKVLVCFDLQRLKLSLHYFSLCVFSAEMKDESLVICNMFRMNTWKPFDEDKELEFFVFKMPPDLKRSTAPNPNISFL